ncbi:MAG: tetratricopeptide repeat protein, partial [Geminicoccaceae bacterium]|nr:tetratricopeptide repeat protein [Geminicoccaceae bacterium]
MPDRTTRILKLVAIALGVAFIGFAVVEKFISQPAPGNMSYHAGNTLFEDGFYERAAAAYRDALDQDPDHLHALRGLARSLHLAGEHDDALLLYDEAISTAPEFGAT